MRNMLTQHFHSKKGIGLIEVIIGATIITVGIVALIAAFNTYITYALANEGNVKAAYLLEEGAEAMIFIRDKGWTTNIAPLSTTTTYYLYYDSGNTTWRTNSTALYIDTNFLRTIGISDVARNSSGAIVTSGGTYDPNTKKVTVTVNYYQGHATTTRSIVTYISNINGD